MDSSPSDDDERKRLSLTSSLAHGRPFDPVSFKAEISPPRTSSKDSLPRPILSLSSRRNSIVMPSFNTNRRVSITLPGLPQFLQDAPRKPSNDEEDNSGALNTQCEEERGFGTMEDDKIQLASKETPAGKFKAMDDEDGDSDEDLPATLAISRPRSSVTIGSSKFPHSRELSETLSRKLFGISVIFIAVGVNVLLLGFTYTLTRGIQMGFSPDTVHYGGGVILEIILLVTNSYTIYAVDKGVTIMIATWLTHKKGYSLAACGFMHTEPALRLGFTNQLSLNSPCRAMLQRIAYVWIFLEAIKLLSPFGATSLVGEPTRYLSTPAKCIEYEASTLRDREWPTFNYTVGVAEFVFGSALGCMRSEMECGGEGSLFVYGPQINGITGQGDTIVGPGFQANVATSCECLDLNRDNMKLHLEPSDVDKILNATITLNVPFLVHSSRNALNNLTYNVSIVLGNVDTCGGASASLLPVCKTVISKVIDAEVASTFMAGDSPASIALAKTEFLRRQVVQVTSTSSFSFALQTVFPPGVIHELPSIIPGMINPILYWTTSNLISTDPGLLDAGVETTVSMLLRAGIQRTFNLQGKSCPRLVSDDLQSMVTMQSWGALTLYVLAALQLAASLLGLAFACVWLVQPCPIFPAMRILEKPTSFTNLLCESPFAINIFGTGNAPRHVIWQNLDIVARIGEAIDSMNEMIGIIRMDRPKFVRDFINGRTYA